MADLNWTDQVGHIRELLHSWRLVELYYLLGYHLVDYDRWDELHAYALSHLGEATWREVGDFVEDHFGACEILALEGNLEPELLIAAMHTFDEGPVLESLYRSSQTSESPLVGRGQLGREVELLRVNVISYGVPARISRRLSAYIDDGRYDDDVRRLQGWVAARDDVVFMHQSGLQCSHLVFASAARDEVVAAAEEHVEPSHLSVESLHSEAHFRSGTRPEARLDVLLDGDQWHWLRFGELVW